MKSNDVNAAARLRIEFGRKLSCLQENCPHERSDWNVGGSESFFWWTALLMCLECDKILEIRTVQAGQSAEGPCEVFRSYAELKNRLDRKDEPLPCRYRMETGPCCPVVEKTKESKLDQSRIAFREFL